MKEKNEQLSVPKEESLKNQLKSADEKQLAEFIAFITEELKSGRYRKVGVQRAVVAVLSQRRPRVNAVTRQAYQAFVYCVNSAASKNQEVMKKLRSFVKANNLSL